jgi:acetyltransferase-like isoleucine patch superfamily enzyme
MLNAIWGKFYTHAFMLYSFGSTLFTQAMDLLPHFIRNPIYKLLLAKMGKGVMIDYKVYMRYLKNIELGDNVDINRGCQFYTSINLGKKIVIGNNVKISPNVKFYGAAHAHELPGMPDNADDIIVEDDCWICADSTILQGVRIYRGSVIAAGSIVIKDIPPNSLAAGNPARVIRERSIRGDY